MKSIKRNIAIIIAVIIITLAPVSTIAQADSFDGFSLFGDSIQTSVYKKPTINKDDEKRSANVRIEPFSTFVRLFFDESHMSLKISEYNLLFDRWEELSFVNFSNYIQINNLSPDTYHKIKIVAGKKYVGTYSFFTKPENISSVSYEVTKSEVTLNWSNENNYLTEIYKRVAGDEDWELLDKVRDCTYIDSDVEQDSHYEYKVRYSCKNSKETLYSAYKLFDEVYVPLEINNILEVNGYVIIRQNDPLNRTIPYPYNDNGKTLGSSGCGVCASLMIVRNMTEFEPKLESYTEKLIEIGARAPYGSNINVISDYLHSEYKLNYKCTKDIEKLKEHLREGNMAIAHVGWNKYFAKSGHFVVVAGIVKDEEENERAIILDPSFKESKYQKQRRIDMGIEYSEDGIVTAPFETLLADCKDEYFTLFYN